MRLLNWTPFVFLNPRAYLSTESAVTSINFERWSAQEYEWEQDGWNGYKDVLTPPVDVVRDGDGDCEDYAFVGASWAAARGKDVTIALCFQGLSPVPQHMVVAFDNNVYSSGTIHRDTNIRRYVAGSQYDWYLTRNV